MFKKFFGSLAGKQKRVSDPVSLPAAVGDSIISIVGARSIPPMPGNAQKAFKLSVNPSADAREFVELIKSDEAMSARMLRVANSVYFDRGKKSTSIEDAVSVIGLNELRSLLNASSLTSLFPSSHPARALAWTNDIGTAIIAKFLADRFFPELSSSAFLAGLMHDVGKLLLIQRTGEEYQKVLRAVESEGLLFHEAEAQVFPFDHTEVGLLIAERWGFDDALRETIRHHHAPFEEILPASLPGLIKAADILCYTLGIVGKGTNALRVRLENEVPLVWEYLGGVEPHDQAELLKVIKQNYEAESDLYRG